MTIDIQGCENVAENEIEGLRKGIICTIALLISLLEERGLLEPGVYRSALAEALVHLTDSVGSPEGRVVTDFVRILDDDKERLDTFN